MASAQTTVINSIPPQSAVDQKDCPACGQAIPPEKLEEIGGRIAARERSQTLEITAQLEKRYASEKFGAASKAKADLESERRQSAQREARAKEETQKAGDKLLTEKLTEVEQNRVAREQAWESKTGDLRKALQSAEETSRSRETEIETLKETSAQAIETVTREFSQREIEIQNKAKQDAEAEITERVVNLEKARRDAEERLETQRIEAKTAKNAAEEEKGSLQAQLNELQKLKEDEISTMKREAEAELDHVRKAAAEEAEARHLAMLAARENEAASAEARALKAEAQLQVVTEQHSVDLEANLKTQREILEKATEDAINLEKSRAFEETQKLTEKVSDLQRALEKKTAEELGEGAEVDLFESLKAEFPEDIIRRVPKGTPGADLIHEVMLCGKKCGTIIYDSKNHNQFRTEHVLKLRADQLALGADHAILSTRKFPQGATQLHLQDGVLLTNPARAVLVATILRQHILRLHSQRLSDIERESKTAALYDFMVSERCGSVFARIDERAEDLLDQQNKEIRWHENNWKKQGEAIRGIQKAKADLENQIHLIIGTSSNDAAA
jgi:hypothetical protein